MRPLRHLLAVACALAAPHAAAQYAEGGARVLGMGRAGVALGGEAWAHTNPAARVGLDERRAAVQASRAFGLSELQLASFAVAAPTPVGVVGLGARTYGFDEHRETRVAVGLGRAVRLGASRQLDVGLTAGYEVLATEGYESVGTPLLSVGVQGRLVSGLRLGLAGRNLLGLGRDADGGLKYSAATVPGLTVGLAYSPSERAVLLLDADQDLEFGLSVRAGAEILAADILALRVGVSTEPVRFTAGAGVRAGPLRADIAVESHETLGLTPAVGVDIGF